jgi:tetrapyrrole methylase family protein/MazG family protein
VVGLGPAGPDLLTAATLEAITRIPVRYLRTARHPSATVLADAESFDELYDRLDTFEEVYATVVERLVAAAARHGAVLYAVPGSPAVAERTVELLRCDERVAVEVVPALSFLDLAWARLGVDPFAAAATVVDAHRFADDVAGGRGPFLVGQCHSVRVLSDVKLAVEPDADMPAVTLLHHLGLSDEQVVSVPWHEIDRTVRADHLTSLWIPRLPDGAGVAVARLERVMAELRERCPWDREQTHESLAKYCIEEADELAEAIRALSIAESVQDPAGEDAAVAHLADELGDVLFQVVFHACLGAEHGRFDLASVADGLIAKLVRRHPHVFADVVVADAAEVKANWAAIKEAERTGLEPRLRRRP